MPVVEKIILEVPKHVSQRNRRLLLKSGEYVEPIKRLQLFEDGQFERFTAQVVLEPMKAKYGYQKVYQLGGANDKGRDVIAELLNGNLHYFQCKNYNSGLKPTEMYVEFGKLVFYTYEKEIKLPTIYFIVAKNGVGATLFDLIKNPSKLKVKLKENWDSHCKDKITKGVEIKMDGEFETYFDSFDFSIIDYLPPDTLIELHKQTSDHAVIFGGGLGERKKILTPLAPEPREERYIGQMLSAFSFKENKIFSARDDLDKISRTLFDHFRSSFFSTESLRIFARDAMPDQEDFNKFLEDVYNSILIKHATTSGSYSKMIECTSHSTTINIQNNTLSEYIDQLDKIGACHHLINESKIDWCEDAS